MKKSMFRLLSLLGTVAILVGSLSIGALFTGVSAATTTVCDGTKASAYAGGTGTEDDPYLIENVVSFVYWLVLPTKRQLASITS